MKPSPYSSFDILCMSYIFIYSYISFPQLNKPYQRALSIQRSLQRGSVRDAMKYDVTFNCEYFRNYGLTCAKKWQALYEVSHCYIQKHEIHYWPGKYLYFKRVVWWKEHTQTHSHTHTHTHTHTHRQLRSVYQGAYISGANFSISIWIQSSIQL